MKTDVKFYRSIIGLAIITGVILLIPLIAMQYTDEVRWTISDFVFAFILLFGTGLIYKFITRKSIHVSYRIAIGFALFTGFFLIWANGAVGIIGSENNPVNLFYYGVIAVGIIGAITARFQPNGLVYTMFAMALAQALVAAIALIGGTYQSPPTTVIEILGVNCLFITLFIVSAWLFRHAANKDVEAI